MSGPKPPPPSKPAAKPDPGDREARLAKALRDNLRRRKAAAPPKPPGPAEEA
jgi:hypothetical protein